MLSGNFVCKNAFELTLHCVCVYCTERPASVSSASITRLDFTVSDVYLVTMVRRWHFLTAAASVRLHTAQLYTHSSSLCLSVDGLLICYYTPTSIYMNIVVRVMVAPRNSKH